MSCQRARRPRLRKLSRSNISLLTARSIASKGSVGSSTSTIVAQLNLACSSIRTRREKCVFIPATFDISALLIVFHPGRTAKSLSALVGRSNRRKSDSKFWTSNLFDSFFDHYGFSSKYYSLPGLNFGFRTTGRRLPLGYSKRTSPAATFPPSDDPMKPEGEGFPHVHG